MGTLTNKTHYMANKNLHQLKEKTAANLTLKVTFCCVVGKLGGIVLYFLEENEVVG